MSDFKPGERTLEGIEILANFCANGSLAAVPELSATPAIAGFILLR